jgi:glycosyltransferase involved in cell wall biosynthesis
MIRFGFIGTLVPHKGANWLIEAFSKLDATLVTLTLWGPLEKPGELSTLRDQPNIRYAGQFSIGHTADIYSQIDCLIVPSRWPENQPLVILQAWQTGTPVITGNLGGMAELVTDGQNGLLYRWLDSTDLLNKLRLFIHDQQLRAKLRQGAQTTKVLSPQEHLDRIVPLLTELQ